MNNFKFDANLFLKNYSIIWKIQTKTEKTIIKSNRNLIEIDIN